MYYRRVFEKREEEEIKRAGLRRLQDQAVETQFKGKYYKCGKFGGRVDTVIARLLYQTDR